MKIRVVLKMATTRTCPECNPKKWKLFIPYSGTWKCKNLWLSGIYSCKRR